MKSELRTRIAQQLVKLPSEIGDENIRLWPGSASAPINHFEHEIEVNETGAVTFLYSLEGLEGSDSDDFEFGPPPPKPLPKIGTGTLKRERAPSIDYSAFMPDSTVHPGSDFSRPAVRPKPPAPMPTGAPAAAIPHPGPHLAAVMTALQAAGGGSQWAQLQANMLGSRQAVMSQADSRVHHPSAMAPPAAAPSAAPSSCFMPAPPPIAMLPPGAPSLLPHSPNKAPGAPPPKPPPSTVCTHPPGTVVKLQTEFMAGNTWASEWDTYKICYYKHDEGVAVVQKEIPNHSYDHDTGTTTYAENGKAAGWEVDESGIAVTTKFKIDAVNAAKTCKPIFD